MATPLKVNRIGLEPQTYKGSKTTLCAGCGHNAISERIIDAFYEMGIDPSQVIKLSGIGCSSKSPAYFLGGFPGFNTLHRRMPALCTGAHSADKNHIVTASNAGCAHTAHASGYIRHLV